MNGAFYYAAWRHDGRHRDSHDEPIRGWRDPLTPADVVIDLAEMEYALGPEAVVIPAVWADTMGAQRMILDASPPTGRVSALLEEPWTDGALLRLDSLWEMTKGKRRAKWHRSKSGDGSSKPTLLVYNKPDGDDGRSQIQRVLSANRGRFFLAFRSHQNSLPTRRAFPTVEQWFGYSAAEPAVYIPATETYEGCITLGAQFHWWEEPEPRFDWSPEVWRWRCEWVTGFKGWKLVYWDEEGEGSWVAPTKGRGAERMVVLHETWGLV